MKYIQRKNERKNILATQFSLINKKKFCAKNGVLIQIDAKRMCISISKVLKWNVLIVYTKFFTDEQKKEQAKKNTHLLNVENMKN